MDLCAHMTEQISAWLDGELTPMEQQELQEHLNNCETCRTLAEQLRTCRSAVAELGVVTPPEGFAQQIMDQIQTEQNKKVVPLRRRPQFRALAGMAACAALCLGLAQLALNSGYGSLSAETSGAAVEEQAACASADTAPASEFCDTFSPESKGNTENTLDAEARGDGRAPSLFTQQSFPLTWYDTLTAPCAQLISDAEQLQALLDAFPLDNLSHLSSVYGSTYFQSGHQLLILLLPQTSSSAFYRAEDISYEAPVLTVVVEDLHADQPGDLVMSAQLLLLELEEAYPTDSLCTILAP